MGAPYLLAYGLGTPVADATTVIDAPADGEYTVWVRAKFGLAAVILVPRHQAPHPSGPRRVGRLGVMSGSGVGEGPGVMGERDPW